MAARAAPAAVIQYGEIVRKNSIWFACRARSENKHFIPDAFGPTLMYFGNESILLAYFKGMRRRGIRVETGQLAAAHTRWLKDESKRDEDSF